MFCIKCGAQMPDGSTFCTTCGSAIPVSDGQIVSAAPSRSYLGKVFKYIGGVFKSPAKNVQELSGEKSMIFLALEIPKLIFSIVAFIMVCLAGSLDLGGAEPIQKAISDSILGDNAGLQVLFAILTYGAAFGVMFLMTWICAEKITKLRVPAVVLLNICSISSVPMLGILLTFMFLGFVWLPLVIILLIAGALLTAVLYTENIRASGIFGSETVWKNALVLCTMIIAAAFFLLLPLAIAF